MRPYRTGWGGMCGKVVCCLYLTAGQKDSYKINVRTCTAHVLNVYSPVMWIRIRSMGNLNPDPGGKNRRTFAKKVQNTFLNIKM